MMYLYSGCSGISELALQITEFGKHDPQLNELGLETEYGTKSQVRDLVNNCYVHNLSLASHSYIGVVNNNLCISWYLYKVWPLFDIDRVISPGINYMYLKYRVVIVDGCCYLLFFYSLLSTIPLPLD
jgi:hypothetical protein